MDPMMLHFHPHQTVSEKGYNLNHHHHHHHLALNGRPNGVPHNQFGQQPLHPGFVLPPKYVSKEEYCSVKSIDDSRASVYFTPRDAHGHGAGDADDERLSQQSIQGTPIHINYLPEGLDIPEDMQMMYHEMQPLQRGNEGPSTSAAARAKGKGKRAKFAMDHESAVGLWSDNPERLSGGASGDAAAEELLMRMSFGRLGNLDEDTSEILLHELIQKKLKRDRRHRMRFYDEQQRRRRLKAVGGDVVAEQGLIEGNSQGHPGGGGGQHNRRRPVLASAMDPEFLRLMTGAGGAEEGLPIEDDHHHHHHRRRGGDYHRVAAVNVMVVDEGEAMQQQQMRRKSGHSNKADILYHSVQPKAVNNCHAWPPVMRGGHATAAAVVVVEESEDEEVERFLQRQMVTSKSLPEISRKRGKRRNKEEPAEVGVALEERGALLGASAAAAQSSIQMATIEMRPAMFREEDLEEQTQTVNHTNSNDDDCQEGVKEGKRETKETPEAANSGSRLINCENNNSGAMEGSEETSRKE